MQDTALRTSQLAAWLAGTGIGSKTTTGGSGSEGGASQ